jgi:glutaredoxin 3
MALLMYVKPNCPYCEQARVGLREKGREFEERDATADPGYREELMRFSRGTGMVPTIVDGEDVVTVGWNGHG